MVNHDDEKPQLDLENSERHQSDEGNNIDADEDSVSNQLEVTFGGESAHRRKSSLNLSKPNRPSNPRQKTSCVVHGLLQDDRLKGDHAPRDEIHPDEKPADKDSGSGKGHATESRLLSKKELSDMAFSIRELSKRLSRFKLKLKVKTVFLLTKAHDEELIGLTNEVADWLLSHEGDNAYTVFVEEKLKDNEKLDYKGLVKDNESRKERLKFWNNELCKKKPHTFDIIIALGGDGTVLYASWLFQKVVPPVLSFALGSLGFLTKFDFDDYKKTLTTAFEEGLTVSLRLRLEATVMRSSGDKKKDGKLRDLVSELIGEEAEDDHTHTPDRSHDILNDLVLDRGPNPTMSSIEVFGDNFHITTVQADGVCVATPTGSTAYNLAAGGSLCHPDNPVILVTAICAHTLSFRPIIIPDTIVLRLGVPYDGRASSWVSFDGKERVELCPGDYVTISASRFPFPSVLPLGRGSEDWIDSLSQTLDWNSRQRQKPYKD